MVPYVEARVTEWTGPRVTAGVTQATSEKQ